MQHRTMLCAVVAFVAVRETGAAQSVQAPAARPEDRRFSYAIDLGAPVPAAPIVVPDGKDLDVGLANVPVSPAYRVVIDAAPNPKETRPLVRGPAPAAQFTSPGCVPLKAEFDAALAEPNEVRLAQQLKAFDEHLARAGCTEHELFGLRYARRQMQPSLRETRTLRPGQVIAYTIERLGQGGAVERSWQVKFLGGRPDLGWKFPDEETFMVAAVAQEIADTAAVARRTAAAPVQVTPGVANAGARSFHIETAGARVPVKVDFVPAPHLWAPSAYVPFAKAAFGTAKGRAGVATAAALQTLTDLHAATIERENRRVSDRLTKDPLDAAAHEEAGLVLAAFALREAAGRHSDVRPAVSRLAAHLAVARALRGAAAPTPAGRIAEIALDTLVLRQTPALEALSRLETAKPAGAEAAWIRALSIRNNGDWRVMARPAEATLLERLMFFDAVTRADSASQALLSFQEAPLEPLPDWGRVVMSRGYSVDEGAQFTSGAAALELADLPAVWSVSHATPASTEELQAALSLSPGSGVSAGQLRVLDWADWGAMAARHVLSANEATADFLRHMLGEPEEADTFEKEADQRLGSLPLHVLRLRPRGPLAPASCAALARFVQASPERMTAANWDRAYNGCNRTTVNYAAWFTPAIPTGTAYDAAARLMSGQIALTVSPKAAASLRALSPYDTTVLLAYIGRKYKGAADPSVYLQEFGRQAEYQLSAMRMLLRQLPNEPARRRPLLEQMCSRSADSCLTLGDELQASDPDAAERAYARAVESALDRVAVSNSVQWLVDRYHDTGRDAEALRVAGMAATAYSRGGLQTMARYLERLQRFDEAATYYQRIADRYHDPLEMDVFYVKNRQRLDEKRHGEHVAQALARVFPQGVQKVALADFQGMPDGVMLSSQTAPVMAWGLQENQVVVALDGVRVRTQHQYGAVKGWSTDPKMRLIVYDGRSYKEIEGERARIVYFRRE